MFMYSHIFTLLKKKKTIILVVTVLGCDYPGIHTNALLAPRSDLAMDSMGIDGVASPSALAQI